MSRIGKRPVPLPKGVTATVNGHTIVVKGAKGDLTRLVHAEMGLTVSAEEIVVTRPSDEPRHKALHGLTRAAYLWLCIPCGRLCVPCGRLCIPCG